jgi:glycosyltransferase involved in cell wall biosynthesis
LNYIPNASNLIKQADVLLIASQITESFGLTAVEAMRHKKPIVSTDTDALKEVIGLDGNAGYCLDKNNYILYAEKIIYLLDNPDARKTMGENGNKRVKAKFNSIRMAKEYHSLLLK